MLVYIIVLISYHLKELIEQTSSKRTKDNFLFLFGAAGFKAVVFEYFVKNIFFWEAFFFCALSKKYFQIKYH